MLSACRTSPNVTLERKPTRSLYYNQVKSQRFELSASWFDGYVLTRWVAKVSNEQTQHFGRKYNYPFDIHNSFQTLSIFPARVQKRLATIKKKQTHTLEPQTQATSSTKQRRRRTAPIAIRNTPRHLPGQPTNSRWWIPYHMTMHNTPPVIVFWVLDFSHPGGILWGCGIHRTHRAVYYV